MFIFLREWSFAKYMIDFQRTLKDHRELCKYEKFFILPWSVPYPGVITPYFGWLWHAEEFTVHFTDYFTKLGMAAGT